MWKHKLQEALARSVNLPNAVLEAQKELDKAICFYLGEAEKFQTLKRQDTDFKIVYGKHNML